MIKIQLTNFRCWKNLKLKFSLGEITLIKGITGKGKSTLFEAIYWCLYGKVQGVAPHLEKNVRTSVKLTFPRQQNEITIQRKNHPQELDVSWCNKKYDHDVAQSLIDNWFGSEDLWLASSYLVQKERNTFFSSTQQSKLQILHEIAYSADNPDVYFHHIFENYQNKTGKYQQALTAYEEDYEQFQTAFTNTEAKLKDLLSPEVFAQYQEDIVQKQAQLQELEKQQCQRNTLLRLQQQLTTSLEHLNNHSSHEIAFPTLSQKLVTQLQNNNATDQWEIHLEYLRDDLLPALQAYDKIYKEYSKYAHITASTKTYSEEEYLAAWQQELEYKQQEKIVLSHRLKYTHESVQSYLLKSYKIITGQHYLQLSAQQRALTEQKKKYHQEYDKLQLALVPERKVFALPNYQEQIETIAQQARGYKEELQLLHNELKDITNTYQCPQCTTYLYLRHEELHMTKIAPDILLQKQQSQKDLEQQLQKLEQKKRKLQEQEKQEVLKQQKFEKELESEITCVQIFNERITTQKEELERKLVSTEREITTLTEEINKLVPYEGSLLSKQELSKIRQTCYELEQVKFISLPTTCSEEIKTCRQNQEKYYCKQKYEKQLQELQTSENITIAEVSNAIKQIRSYIGEKEKHEKQEQQIILEKKLYEEQLSALQIPADTEKEKVALTTLIQQLQEIIHKHELIQKKTAQHQVLLQERAEVMFLHEKIYLLTELQDYGKKAECRLLQDVVLQVNRTLEQILQTLFDEPFHIALQLFKLPKSKKVEKPQVNFEIRYREAEYTNIRQLSGGEGDCTSLAFTLALHQLTGTPFIIIDESLLSMDEEKCEMILEYLKTQKVTALVTLHQTMEGFFDQIIDLSQY